MKFTLIAEHETGEKVTYEFENDYLYNVLDNVDLFLRGAGFVPDGTLAYTEEEVYGMEDEVDHSPYYYDLTRNRSFNRGA